MSQQELDMLKRRTGALRRAMKREISDLRKRLASEIAYMGATYGLFAFGIFVPDAAGKVVALGLGGTSSVRVLDKSKEVAVQYFKDAGYWKKPLDLIEDLIDSADPNDRNEVEQLKTRVNDYRDRLIKSADMNPPNPA